MRMRTLRRVQRTQAARRSLAASDATTEPDPGPPPEAVFDRVTGPYARRSAVALSGASASGEET